ncbi:MAG: hypothetical protein KGZ85_18140 [Ignavibacterium sp.]|nr:hypothetical protein [Ignavibacterium sp.]
MKFLKENINKEWYDEFCEGSLIFISLPAHAVGQGIICLKNQYKGAINFFYQEKTHWMTLVEDQNILAEEILNKYLENKKYWQEWFKKWQNRTKVFSLVFEKIIKIDLSSLSEKTLWRLHDQLWSSVFKARQIDMVIDSFMFGGERILVEELKKFCRYKYFKNIGIFFQVLTLPEKESLTSKVERELIKIAVDVRKNKINRQILESPLEVLNCRAIKRYLQKYCWLKGNWGMSVEYSINELIKEIKELLKGDLKKTILERNEQFSSNKKKRKNLLKRIKFNKRIRELSNLSVFFSHWTDLRKINALKFIYCENRFLKEFSRRYKLNFEGLKLFDITELKKILKNRKRFNREVKKRKKLFLAIHSHKRFFTFFGSKVKNQLHHLISINININKIESLSGMGACSGKVKGRVKIIHQYREFYKFKKGDILVTGMTRPEFVSLMKKAKAVVTNDGGITSHAAIISRELNVPCIIGTKIATKVLKDGDLIEVDANQGIIRKIK